uniref:Uncharacterized protein n=1 Tax=Romanomermis culicivorax TaxID=13658 RepID=A0A915IHQ6_ROMCU
MIVRKPSSEVKKSKDFFANNRRLSPFPKIQSATFGVYDAVDVRILIYKLYKRLKNTQRRSSSDDTDDSEYNGIIFHRMRRDTDVAYQRRVEPGNVEFKHKSLGNDKRKGTTGVPQ